MKDENEKTSPPDSSSATRLIDPVVLLAACGGDPTMLRKMCRTLQSLVPEYLAAVRDALHDQDAPGLREAAHKFYGTLSAFSTVAGDQAADLEDLAARGRLEAPALSRAHVDEPESLRRRCPSVCGSKELDGAADSSGYGHQCKIGNRSLGHWPS